MNRTSFSKSLRIDGIRLVVPGVLFAVLFLLTCEGRNVDKVYVPPAFKEKLGLGLVADKPMVVSFGAGWCKPCRKEIALFNELQLEESERLEIVGFLVEGEGYGATPTEDDIDGFVDARGERLYKVLPDEDWKLFQSFAPAEGKKLPFILLINRDFSVAASVQNAVSSSDESSFRSWVVETLGLEKSEDLNQQPGETAPEPEEPQVTETPTESGPPPVTAESNRPSEDLLGSNFVMTEWLELFGSLKEQVQSNYTTAWRTAIEENYFTEEEMHFAEGTVTFVSNDGDGITQTVWSKSTEGSLCLVEMESTLLGQYIRSTSQCVIIKDKGKPSF